MIQKGGKILARDVNAILEVAQGPAVGSNDLGFVRTSTGTIYSRMNSFNERPDVQRVKFLDVQRAKTLTSSGLSGEDDPYGTTLALNLGESLEFAKRQLGVQKLAYFDVSRDDGGELLQSDFQLSSGWSDDGWLPLKIARLQDQLGESEGAQWLDKELRLQKWSDEDGISSVGLLTNCKDFTKSEEWLSSSLSVDVGGMEKSTVALAFETEGPVKEFGGVQYAFPGKLIVNTPSVAAGASQHAPEPWDIVSISGDIFQPYYQIGDFQGLATGSAPLSGDVWCVADLVSLSASVLSAPIYDPAHMSLCIWKTLSSQSSPSAEVTYSRKLMTRSPAFPCWQQFYT